MRIETERLILRPFAEGDEKDVFEYLENPTQSCFFDMKKNSLEEVAEDLRRRKKNPLYLAVTLKESGKVIGELFAGPEATAPDDPRKDTYSPCWMIHPAYWGKGYGFEAAWAYIDRLFRTEGARRVYMYTEDTNTACRKLCEKLGARKEGLFLEYVSFYNDEAGRPVYENTMQYAILRREWFAKTGGHRFWGWETADCAPVDPQYRKIADPRALYDVLELLWSAETCAPRMRKDWTPENKTLGQCSITAFLAQDLFGGTVYGIKLPDGNYHCFNQVGSCRFDLTSEQFGGETLDYENASEQLREVHFAKEEKRLRYEALRDALDALIRHKTKD